MSNKMVGYMGELKKARSVLWQLVRQQLILRYRRTALGYFWTLISPLLMMSVTAVVFSTLFKLDLKSYTVFLFAGMIPWNCFSSIVSQSGGSLINNEGLIKKIYLPKLIFPLSVALGILIDSILSFFALFLIIMVIGANLSWAMLFIPVAYVLLFLFAAGLGFIISVMTVFFRDLQHVIVIVMQAWFYLTPVMYKHDALTGVLTDLIKLNPLVPFIELFRAPLYAATLPSAATVFVCAAYTMTSLVIGFLFFFFQEKKIVFRL